MTLQEIKDFLKTNADQAEVKSFLESLNPIDSNRVKVFLETEDGKKIISSLTDQRVTQGIDTFKKNNLGSLIEAEITKRFPEETAEQKRIRELEGKFEKAQRDATLANLRTKALSVATEKKLPVELLELINLGDTEEAVSMTLTKLAAHFEKAVTNQVQDKFKQGGRTITEPDKLNYTGKNPWAKGTLNLTEQGKLLRENPDLAKALMQQAGK